MKHIREHQLELLEMLIEIKKILYKENINFFLIGGSVLGAIRHNGFIPWDDDIDIAVYRKDFQKLEEILEKNLKYSKYIYYKAGNKNIIDQVGRLYVKKEIEKNEKIKVIDIHPIDSIPESKILCFFQFIAVQFYYLFLWQRPAKNKGRVGYLITKLLLLLTPQSCWDELKEKINRYIARFSNIETKKIANIHGIKGYWKEIMPREYIGTPVLKKFEGEMFYIPEKWHEYLTFLYGDYMKLPDEKDRKPRHGLKESEESK